MKTNRKLALVLGVLLLLISLSSTHAEVPYTDEEFGGPIPFTEEEMESAVKDRFVLTNAIGVHEINLSKGGRVFSQGWVTVSNTYDERLIINIHPSTELSASDLDENGNPRAHLKVQDDGLFYQFETPDWIVIDYYEIVIPPMCKYAIKYNVDISSDDAWRAIHEDKGNGLLGYITFKKVINATGFVVGVEYNHKVFVTFFGERNTMLSPVILAGSALAILVVGYFSVIKFKKAKAKKLGR